MTEAEPLAVYIFGSVGRGQQDNLSDLDVLAVVKNGQGKVPEHSIFEHIPEIFLHLKPTISWYGGDRIREMFRNGELFAWHLYRETVSLYDPTNFLSALGEPAPYRDSIADVHSFQKVLNGIPLQVASNEYNAVYEAGLVYVCLRNIAMAASWSLCNIPNFGRYSAFELPAIRECPISRQEFNITMACRMAAQRGKIPPTGVDATFVMKLYLRLNVWIEELCRELERRKVDG